MDLTKYKDSHPLLSHLLVVKVSMVQKDQILLSKLVLVVYLEFRIYYIAKNLVVMGMVET